MTQAFPTPAAGWVLLLPQYNPELKSGSIILPETATEDMPQTGIVMASSVEYLAIGDRVCFRRYEYETFGPYYFVHKRDIPAIIEEVDSEKELVPVPGYCLVLPDTPPIEEMKSGLILPKNLTYHEPIQTGTVLLHADTDLIGKRVIIPKNTGLEIGFIDTVYYVIPTRDIPATIGE